MIPQQASSAEESSSQSSFGEQELVRGLRTIRKLHKMKKERLRELRKSRNGNQLFYQMSLFFHRKKEIIDTLHKKKEELIDKVSRITNRHFRKECFHKLQKEKLALGKQLEQDPRQDWEIEEPASATSSDVPIPSVPISVCFRCYICKKGYSERHFFYRRLCNSCADQNLLKRTQSANLKGLTALVTGGRIKIGFEIAKKLLNDGCTVFVTSRFYNDTLLRYQKQANYETWKDRLHVIQCDFVSAKQVNDLIAFLLGKIIKLDILINNAAQTIVRIKEFYTFELNNERLQLANPPPADSLQLIENHEQVKYPSLFAINQMRKVEQQAVDLSKVDEFGQPIDTRIMNSWKMKIEQVSLSECYTTQLVNSIVPFHLISRLKPLMVGSTPSWIINVSSMEGVFYRNIKQQFHPHTNMAKAALNMITRTCAYEFQASRIYMNSVDTGWVTNQNPQYISQRMGHHNFECPLDCLDGAMRVLDPIYIGVKQQQFPFGKFLKDYKQSFF